MFAESVGFPEKIDVNPTDDIFLEGVEKSWEVLAFSQKVIGRRYTGSRLAILAQILKFWSHEPPSSVCAAQAGR